MSAGDQVSDKGYTRKSAVAAGWSILSTVARQTLSFLSIAYLARRLGPATYGLMAMVALFANFLSTFRDMGTAAAIVQRPTISTRLLSSIFWINVGFGVILSGIVAAASGAVAHFFHEPALRSVMIVFAPSFLFTSLGAVHNAVLSREFAFRSISLSDMAAAVAGYAVAITMATNDMGVWSLVFANLAMSATSSLGYWLFCRWRPAWQFDWQETQSITGFGFNLSLFGLMNYFARNADNLVIGRFLGTVQLGFYQSAYNLMLFPLQNVSSLIAQATYPAFARVQEDHERFRSGFIRSAMLTGLVTFPMMAGLASVADPFVRTILGPKWVSVIPILVILAPIGLVQSVNTMVGLIFMSKARTDWMSRWGLVSTIILVSSFLIGVRWGATGVAAAYATAYFGLVMYPSFAIPFYLIGLRFRDFALAMTPQLAIAIAMGTICRVFLWLVPLQGEWVRLLSAVVLGVVVYVVFLWVFKPPVLKELGSLIENFGDLPIAKRLAGATQASRSASASSPASGK